MGEGRRRRCRPTPSTSMANRSRWPSGSASARSSRAAKAAICGLRVFVGQRQAFVSSTDFAPEGAAHAWPSAPSTWRAPCRKTRLRHRARRSCWPRTGPTSISTTGADRRRPRRCSSLAAEAEDAARAVKGVTNSEGAEASWGRTPMMLATSNGFCGGYRAQRLFAVLRRCWPAKAPAWSATTNGRAPSISSDLMAAAKVGRNAGTLRGRAAQPEEGRERAACR